LATFDISSVIDQTIPTSPPTSGGLYDMLRYCDINAVGTTTNYDNTLISWSTQAPHTNLTFNGGNSKYSNCHGQSVRNILLSTYFWNISDGGMVNC